MKLVKGAVLGTLGGLLYAFSSFYLVTPYLRKNLAAIVFFGLQGFIFGIVYALLTLLTQKIKMTNKEDLRLSRNVMIGAVSGLFSGIYNITATYYTAIVRVSPKGFITEAVRNSIISELMHFTVGSIVIGSIIGFIIGWKKRTDLIDIK